MRILRLAAILGLIIAIPICSIIYFGVTQLESGAKKISAIRDEFQGFESLTMPLPLVSRNPYPQTRELTHSDGRTLNVVITGRTQDEVNFLSLRDNNRYGYPIGNLSARDRDFIHDLPIENTTQASYPIYRQLQNFEGTTINTIIDGRSKFDVFFRLVSSNKAYRYSIQQLSPTDRDFVFSLEINR